jgi:hypothetical protein
MNEDGPNAAISVPRGSWTAACWTAAVFGLLSLASWSLTLFGRNSGEAGMTWFIPLLYASYPTASLIGLFDTTRDIGQVASDLAFGNGLALLIVPINAALAGIVGFIFGRCKPRKGHAA